MTTADKSPASRTLLGVDLGGTSLRMLLEHPDGTTTGITRKPAPSSYPELLDVIAAYTGQVARGPVSALGIGVPGTTDRGTAGFMPALPWLEGQPLGPDLTARLGGPPVTVANDAALTLLAEARRGAARDVRSAVLVTVGTGIGGALMIERTLWRGAHGSAGSWGWLSAPDAEPGSPHGGFEQAASGTALQRLAGDGGAEKLVERARSGDAAATEVLDRYARRLGRGLAALASTLDPELLIIAGGVSDALDVISTSMDDERRRWGSPHGQAIPVVAAELGWTAGVVGAVEVARSERDEVWT